MKREASLIFALVIVFLVSMLPMTAFSRAADSHGGSGSFETQSTIDWWPMFHHDLPHSGYSTATAPTTNHTAWTYATCSYVFSSPAAVDGMVYVGSEGNNVYCLDTSSGALVWNYTTCGYVFSSPAVLNGLVYVGSMDGNVYALDATTGAPVWNFTTASGVKSSPAVADGKVYVGSDDGSVYCLNASSGVLVWAYATGGAVSSSPAVVDGVVYVGSDDDNVYALNATTGAFVWKYTTGSWVYSSPAVADGVVYVGSYDNNFYCLNASTGMLVWNYTAGLALSSPAVAGGDVYLGLEDEILCLNGVSGMSVWSYTTGCEVDCSPAVVGGMVYVGLDDGNVCCLNGSTGALVWSYVTGGAVFSSPAVAEGMLYVGSEDGNVYCFGPSQTYVYSVAILAHSCSENADVSVPITMDGLPTGYETPYTFTGLTSTHNFTVTTADASNDAFLDWVNGERTTTITVSSGGVYTAYYVASGETILPVPFRYQEKDYYCGPACLQMVFSYYGASVLQSEIACVARTIGFPLYAGTMASDLRRAAQFSNISTSMGDQLSHNITGYASRQLGYSAFEAQSMNLTVLESFLDQGKPLILIMWYSSRHVDGHFRVAVGYNQTDVFLQDPYNRPLWGGAYGGPETAFNISQFMDLWSRNNYWALYVAPWNITFSVPTNVASGTPFQVQSTITYPQPPPNPLSTYPASICHASITLPVGLSLAPGEKQTKTIGTGLMQPGNIQNVTWMLTSNSSVAGTIGITAEGRISGWVGGLANYPAYGYSDMIGATVNFSANLTTSL
jgi:outer membrane protein assembly factor BamB